MNEWRNRIVRSGWIDPEQLLAHPLNYRIHPKFQTEALKANLDELGQYKPIVVQDGTDVVVDGHARVALALREGKRQIWCDFVDLDNAETNVALATGDPISALAEFDKAKYGELLSETSTGEAATMALLAQIASQNSIVPPDTFDPNAEWQDMPEFDHPDINSVFQVVVHFAHTEDLDAFERLIGQSVPRKSKVASSIWYPEADQLSNDGLGYASAES